MAAAHSPPPPPPPPPPPASSCYRSPQRTPNSNNNNYASTKTPILSAKRPKKWSSSPKPSIGGGATTTTTPSSSSSCSTPTTASIAKIKKTLHATTLSPMHNVRPVPRDSHHVVNPTATSTAAATAASTNKYGAPETTISTGTSYATTTTISSAAAVDTLTNKSEHHSKQYSLTMIDELEVHHSSSRHETRNNNNNTADIGGGDEKEDDSTSAIANNNGPSSASWVGRKVDAIFSPVLSFLSGTTTTTSTTAAAAAAAPVTSTSCDKAQQGADDYEDDYEDDYDDDDEGKFIQRSPTTQSTNLEDESESYMHDDFDEENNHVYNAVNNDIAATTSSSAALKIARRSSDSTSTTTTVRDVDGDVTMAENYKLHYPLHCDDDDGDDEEVVVAATVYHDEESPPTPTVDKYEHYHGKEQQNVSSRSKNEERERVNADSNNNDEDVGDVDDDEDEDEFNPYLFIKCLPPYHYAIPPGWFSRPKALPPIDTTSHPPIPPICLVLDLDETLVHCTVEAVSDADMIFPVEFHGVEYQVHVRCRPYLREFLEAVSDKFEVVIFTASQQVYADKLLDKIDPEGRFIRHRMFRDSCLPVEGNFLKDLSILGRDLSKAVLVDNSPHAFGYQVDNGIPIESWFDDPTDKELLKLEMFLRTLHGVDDVREVVRKTFQTHRLVMDA